MKRLKDSPKGFLGPHVYNWVASVARKLPHVTFHPSAAKRDGKTRVILHYQNTRWECVVEDDSPDTVVFHLTTTRSNT
jgi:hypothetical protein